MSKTTFTIGEDKKTLRIERTFNAPQYKLWRAYSEKDVFAQWFAPKGWEVTSKKFDFRDGGENIYTMKCVDKAQGEWFGQTSSGKMVFSSIHAPESLSYTDYFTDEDGNVNKDMPTSQTSLQLVDNGDNTTTLRVATKYATEDALKQVVEMGMQQGYSQTLDKLEELVKGL